MSDDFGIRIRRLRMAAKLPIAELARMVELHPRELTAIENGSIAPAAIPEYVIGSLAWALGVSKSGLLLHAAKA